MGSPWVTGPGVGVGEQVQRAEDPDRDPPPLKWSGGDMRPARVTDMEQPERQEGVRGTEGRTGLEKGGSVG